MPNGYLASPSTVFGNMIVTGDIVRIGSVAPFMRLQRLPTLAATVSMNVDTATDTPDNTGQGRSYLELRMTNPPDASLRLGNSGAGLIQDFLVGHSPVARIRTPLDAIAVGTEVGKMGCRAKAAAAADNFACVHNFHERRGVVPSSVTLTNDGGFPVNCTQTAVALDVQGFILNIAATAAGDMEARGTYTTVGG